MIDWAYVAMLAGFASVGASVVNASVGVLWKVAGVVTLAILSVLAPFFVDGGIFCAVGLVLGVVVGSVVAVGRAVYARVGKARRTE